MESLEARLARLEGAFLSSGGKVVLYSLEDLFEVSNGNIDIQKNDIEDSWEVVISAWENNCWIIGKTTKQAKIFEKDTITIDMFWYSFLRNHPYKMVTHGRVMSLNPQNKNRYYLLYLLSSLQYLKNRYWFDNMLTWNKIREEIIHLPTYSNWEIAYEYMENYIKEIEKYHIEELREYHIKEIEAYLKAAGLSDYELTKDEVKSLKTIGMGGGRKFTLDELFEVRSNPQLDKRFFEFKEDGEYPYFTRTVLNNGIAWYVKYLDDEHLTKGNCLAVGMLWMQFFYMKQDFYSWQFTKSLFPKFKGFNSTLAHFFISFLNKKSKDFQSVLIRDFVKEFNNTEIILPVDSDNQINYPLIETYIKATQKLVIKDLVDNINKKLETYKQII